MRIQRIAFVIIFSAMVLNAHPALAQDRNFSLAAQGRHFDIYTYRGVDITTVLFKLDYQSFHPGNIFEDPQADLSTILAQTLDAIFAETSDILDIHMYSFRGTIRIVPTRDEIARIFARQAGFSMKERAYYFYEENTIYVSAEDLAVGVLGHEIAHAIVSHYFVVPPSMNVQEILCGYVDFTLRKRRSKLPARQ